MARILIVDDNADHRLITRITLEPFGFELADAENATAGLDRLRAEHFDCLILDHRMEGDSGLVMLHEMQKNLPSPPPVIFLSAVEDDSLKRNVMALGAFAYIDKLACSPDVLKHAVDEALAKRQVAIPS